MNLSRVAVLDLETIPNMEACERVVSRGKTFHAPSTWKDPVKIANHIREKEEEWVRGVFEDASLHPLRGRTASFTVKSGVGSHTMSLRGDMTDSGERKLLDDLYAFLDSLDIYQIVTCGGSYFDMPWLRVRSLVLGVPFPRRFEPRRYRSFPHCDIQMVLTGWDSKKLEGYGLGAVCDALGVENPKEASGMTGADVWERAKRGAWDEIEAYNAADGVATWTVFEKMLAAGMIEEEG